MTTHTSEARGRSLTPADRSDEVTGASFRDGLIAGALTFIPSGAAVWYGLNYSAKFRKVTNAQSRTALVIMPPLFMFGVASEVKLQHTMHKMAGESEHAANVSQWAEKHLDELEDARRKHAQITKQPTTYTKLSPEERERKLSELYKKSVAGSEVRIVPGDKLSPFQTAANYWQENPFKILAGLGLPSVAYIFHQRHGKAHLDLQQQIMQTRVVGQFTVLIFLLSLMGFKEYMDQNGKFITEVEAERRVEEVRAARKELEYRIAEDMVTTKHNIEQLQAIHHEEPEAAAGKQNKSN